MYQSYVLHGNRATGFPGGSEGKSICLQCGRFRFDPWIGKIPWKRKWQPAPVLLPGKSHGQRSPAGYSQSMGLQRVGHDWATSLSFFSCCMSFPGGSGVKNPPPNAGDEDSIPGSGKSPGEGNCNPLQYSCLGNPKDREARLTAVHGVAKSVTRLTN